MLTESKLLEGTSSEVIPRWYGVAEGRVANSSRIKSFVTKVIVGSILASVPKCFEQDKFI